MNTTVRRLSVGKDTIAPVQPAATVAAGGTFSYDELKAGTPHGVDPTQKEIYLNDTEFVKLFGSDKATFAKSPKWKKDQKKKDLGLF